MKLASFQADGKDRLGLALDDSTLVDAAEAAEAAGMTPASAGVLTDMLSLIELGAAGHHTLQQIQDHVAAHPHDVPRYAAADIRWHAPVRRPSKIVCLALNNSANKDRIIEGPSHPAPFIKGANALTGHQASIVLKPQYGRVHPEPELAVVIGKTAKDVPAEDAYDYVFGYTIHNDVTSPAMRKEDTFHYRAIHPKPDNPDEVEYVDTWVTYPGRYKGSDTFSPMGPWLVTKDAVPDPHVLDVSCIHQGQTVTADNTENLFYKFPEVLAFLSQYMTCLPGDVISMGTALKPRTGGGGRAVQNVDLHQLGGPVAVKIDGLGRLENPVEMRNG